MSCQTLHLINSELGCRALKQGVSFGLIPFSNGLQFFFPGDLTDYTIVGQIRAGTADTVTTALADFVCSSPVYGQKVVDGVPQVDSNNNPIMGSVFSVQLPAVVNPAGEGRSRYLAVPPKSNKLPKLLDSTTIDDELANGLYKLGQHFWLYDLQAIPPGADPVDAIGLIDPSLVQVIGESTDA